MVRIAGGVVDGAARNARNTGISVVRVVSAATPVDTTLARSNWLAGVGTVDLSERRPRSRSDVINESRATLTHSSIKLAILSHDEVQIHIANGGDKVPYLEWLNRGSSRQAPAGFVGLARDEVRTRTAGKARLLTFVRGSLAKGV
jgi:hypothetical protein